MIIRPPSFRKCWIFMTARQVFFVCWPSFFAVIAPFPPHETSQRIFPLCLSNLSSQIAFPGLAIPAFKSMMTFGNFFPGLLTQ